MCIMNGGVINNEPTWPRGGGRSCYMQYHVTCDVNFTKHVEQRLAKRGGCGRYRPWLLLFVLYIGIIGIGM